MPGPFRLLFYSFDRTEPMHVDAELEQMKCSRDHFSPLSPVFPAYLQAMGFLRRLKGLVPIPLNGWRSRRPDSYEHPMVQASSRWIDKRLVAFFLAYGAVVLGVWAEFDNGLGEALGRALSNIGDAFDQLSLEPLARPPHWRTVIFCILLSLIANVLWLRLKADDRRQDERTLGTLRALYRVPNISAMRQYPEGYWPAFLLALREGWPNEKVPVEEQRPAMARAIRDALAVIIQMAHDFRSRRNRPLRSQYHADSRPG